MSTSPDKTPRSAEALLSGKIASAKRALVIERLWPALVAPAAILALFLALSWFGLWLHLPTWGRAVGVGLFALGLLWSLKGLVSLKGATDADARARLDRDSGVKHRPVEAVTDKLLQDSDATSKALWALHQKRAAEAVEKLSVKPPEPAMRRLDPRALRFAPFAMALAALFVAGPEMVGRVGVAFNWFTPPPPPPPPRLDVWIDPPSYTGRPPIFLAQSRSGAEATPKRDASIEVPVGATLVIRATPADGMSVTATSGLKALESSTSAGTAFEQRFRLEDAAEATVKRGGETLARYGLVAIPDAPPSIRIVQALPTEQRDGLRIVYAMRDDYGVKEAEGRFSKIARDGQPARRTLVPGPPAPLASGGRGDSEADSETVVMLAEHPWAGARVRLQLHAVDDAGNKAESDAREVTLPQRAFSHPLAKALVEQRRNLVMEPDDKGRVQIALDALLSEPERFYAKDSGAYLGLRLAATRLRAARTDDQLIGVAEWLWTMALELEDGGLSDAEKALRAAQERLQEALERNADAAEIRRLTEELRRAMDRYMREFAERQQRDNRNAENQQNNENTRTLNRNDMQKMLQDIERLSREGKHAEAMELLRQLNEAMKNLQARRENGQQGERQRGMGEAMDELDQLSREQQELRDQTFREGQQRRRQQGQQGQRSQREQGQQGQRGQRGQRGQQGQQGQQGDGGEQDMAEGGDGQGEGQGQSLQQRQQRLRERLRQLQRRLGELGMGNEQGLADADGAMGDAEGQLGQGQEGRAVDSQGRALDGLRRGMQGMARQMQQQGDGEGDGAEQAEGGPGGDDPNRPGRPRADSGARDSDPLGRDTRSRSAGENSRLRMQGHEGGTAGERARRVLEELRRRLGEQDRPRLELDYFERLLPRN